MKRKNGEGTWGKKRINGHEYFYYRSPEGRYSYGKTNQELLEKVELETKRKSIAKSVNDVTARPQTTFYNYVRNYIDSIRMTLQPYSYYNYTHMVDNLLKNTKLGHRQLHQITPDMISNYYAELAEKYSYSTILSLHKILRGPLRAAEDDGLIKLNTTRKINVPKERYCKPVKKLYIPNIDEMKAIEAICFEQENGKYKLHNNGLALVVIMHTGLRIGELVALRWNDVDTESRLIDVNKSASFRVINGKHTYEDKEPKSKAGYRKIPYDDTVAFILDYLKEDYPSKYSLETGHVFCSSRREHISKSAIEQVLAKRIAPILGAERLTPHTLRHAYSSYLAYNKVNPKVIAKLMGHEKVDFTYNVYVEAYDDEMIEAAQLFNRLSE